MSRIPGADITPSDVKEYYKLREKYPELTHLSANEFYDYIEEEKEREHKEKAEIKETRQLNRYIEPPNHSPIKTISDLQLLSDTNVSFAENSLIKGSSETSSTINADLSDFNLQKSVFESVEFSCEAQRANFSGSIFRNVTFTEKCYFSGANFSESQFDSCDFKGSFSKANFSKSIFKNTTIANDINVSGADFSNFEFDDSFEIQFDSNRLIGVDLEKFENDQWTKLVRSYSGATQFLNMVLCLTYFAGLYLKITILQTTSSLQTSIAKSKGRDPNEYWKEVGEKLGLEIGSEKVISVLIGEHKYWIWFTIFLFLYQATRFWVTSRISPLIDTFRFQQKYPSKDAYHSLLFANRFLQYFGVFVIVIFGYEISRSLGMDVAMVKGALQGNSP